MIDIKSRNLKLKGIVGVVNKINLKDSVNEVDELFSYKRVGTLNNHMLNVLQSENRTLDFHVHENSDEMFYCIEGEFDIEFEDGVTHLCEGDFIIVPKGTRHRPVCKRLVKCLLMEVEGTLNKDNTGGTYKEKNLKLMEEYTFETCRNKNNRDYKIDIAET